MRSRPAAVRRVIVFALALAACMARRATSPSPPAPSAVAEPAGATASVTLPAASPEAISPTLGTANSLPVANVGPVNLTVLDRGSGRPLLLLHGGTGPARLVPFVERLVAAGRVRVVMPTHPGFESTPRPEALSTPYALAVVYSALLEQMDLKEVIVVGNSIGGWIGAELALLQPARIRDLVLADAVGIEVDGHPVADISSMTSREMMQRSFYEPKKFAIDPRAFSEARRAARAANRAALATYGVAPPKSDSTLRTRIHAIAMPTLVLWGEADRIVDATYGNAWATSIPGARFKLLPKAGHVPLLETPDVVIAEIFALLDASKQSDAR